MSAIDAYPLILADDADGVRRLVVEQGVDCNATIRIRSYDVPLAFLAIQHSALHTLDFLLSCICDLTGTGRGRATLMDYIVAAPDPFPALLRIATAAGGHYQELLRDIPLGLVARLPQPRLDELNAHLREFAIRPAPIQN